MALVLGYKIKISNVCAFVSRAPSPPASGTQEDCSFGIASSSCLGRHTHTTHPQHKNRNGVSGSDWCEMVLNV